MDLKRVLQEMGATLVEQYGFKPSSGLEVGNQSTEPIVKFLIWLEKTPEAKQVLKHMGYMPERQSVKMAQ